MTAMPSTKLTVVIFVVLLLSGCVLPSNLNYPGVESLLTNPASGSILPLGHPVGLYAASSFPEAGPTVERFTFYANALQIAEVLPGASGPSWANGNAAWTPPEAGEFQLQVWGRLSNDRLAISRAVRICVLDITFSSLSSPGADGYSGPCELPATPIIDPSAPVTLSTTPAPVSLPFATASCPVSGALDEITFSATVNDAGNRVAFVIVDMEIHFNDPGDTFDAPAPLALNQTSSTGTYKVFTGTTTHLEDFLGDPSLTGSSSLITIRWTARAFDRTGAVLVTDGPLDLLAGPCEPPIHPLISASPTPSLFTILPTNTPQGLCPPGTYYAPVTNQCIPVQIKPTKSGGPNCSQYTTDTSCNAAPGCAYDYVAKKCKGQ